MDKLAAFIALDKHNSVMLCQAEGRICCRLGTVSRWDLDPDKYGHQGRMRDELFDCIGYGDTTEQAVEEAFKRLPG